MQPPGGRRSFGLAVGASDLDGSLASFSNSGRTLSLLAPGNYYGTCTGVLVALAPVTEVLDEQCHPLWHGDGGARYAYLAGTSFAAPEVAGVAALIWAARPELKNYQVADIIKQSARRNTGWTPTLGCGVLDAAAALALATQQSAASAPVDDAACTTGGDDPPTWPAQLTPPTVVALTASGKRGTTVNLPFRVVGVSREVAATIAAQNDGITFEQRTRGFFTAQPGRVYHLAWRAPRAAPRGALRFCVVLTDRAGNKSASSCAPIRLR